MTDPTTDNVVAMQSATTRKSTTDTSGCRDCGWPFGPDLVEAWVLGRRCVVCVNPWRCRERQAQVEEYLSRILN